jgi:hypothetical protein
VRTTRGGGDRLTSEREWSGIERAADFFYGGPRAEADRGRVATPSLETAQRRGLDTQPTPTGDILSCVMTDYLFYLKC